MGFARKGASLFARGYESLPGAPFRSLGCANALRCLLWAVCFANARVQVCFAPCRGRAQMRVGLFFFHPPFVVFDGEGVFFAEWEVLSLSSFVAVFDVYAVFVGYLVDGFFFLLGE